MKKRIKSAIATMGLGVLLTGTLAFAATNWTDYEKLTITNDAVTSNNSCTRYGTDSNFEVKVKDKTMTSTPTSYLVNSDGDKRSNKLSLPGTSTYTGSGNTCEKNHVYWLVVKPAWNQVGSDMIHFQFSVH